jgi:hypothetical protein
VFSVPWRNRISAVNRVAVANQALGVMDDDLATARDTAESFLGHRLGIALGWVKRASSRISLAFVLPKPVGPFSDVPSFRHRYLLVEHMYVTEGTTASRRTPF